MDQFGTGINSSASCALPLGDNKTAIDVSLSYRCMYMIEDKLFADAIADC
jgi:hypothetical protein